MALIKPFRGYRPPADLAHKITSPPYDVMTSDEARDIVQDNPYSFLRVIKPEIDFTSNNDLKGDALHEHGYKNLKTFINDNVKLNILNKKVTKFDFFLKFQFYPVLYSMQRQLYLQNMGRQVFHHLLQ